MDKKEEIKNQIEFAEESIEFYKRKVKESEEEKSELEAELEELEQEEQEWKPQKDEKYWLIDLDYMTIKNVCWSNDNLDNIRLQHKVIFKTEAEAEEYLEYLKAKEKAMNEFSKEEWENTGIFKYRFCINCSTKKFVITLEALSREFNALYFRQRHEVQEFIDKYEKFLRRELGV